MKVEDILSEQTYVNEELLYMINEEIIKDEVRLIQWSETFENKGLIKVVKPLIKFVSQHINFHIALKPLNLTKGKFIPYLIYNYKGEFIRVQIENTSCVKCNWKGIIANPTVPGLFDTVNNKIDALKNVNRIEVFDCPICGAKLNRKAIWIENE